MFSINLKHSLAIVGVGLLAAAASASAATDQPGVIAYNGHAGLGASVYQHNQTDLEFLALSPQGPGSDGVRLGSNDARAAGVQDGTSNTIAFGERAAAPRGFSIDIGTSENVAADGREADIIMTADMGGQF
jgi:opacity protein-like surface antigen